MGNIATAFKSNTSLLGFPRVSAYRSFVLLFIAASKFLGSVWSTKLTSIPWSRRVFEKRFAVPP
jgi:hypothetical protein